MAAKSTGRLPRGFGCMIPIRLNKSAEFISLRGKLIFTAIYADMDEIDHVYALIRQSCVNLKDKT